MHDDDTLLADLRPVRRALSSQGGALFDLSAQTGSRSSGPPGSPPPPSQRPAKYSRARAALSPLGPFQAWLMAGSARICYSSSMVKQ